MEELSPRARRLVESGLIDTSAIAGSGEGGKLTSGDILHAARIMEVEQSVARIEATQPANDGEQPPDEELETPASEEEPSAVPEEPTATVDEVKEHDMESATFAAVDVGGEPIVVEPNPWEDYNGSTDGFSGLVREGAEQSWGEAEAHLAAMAEEAAGKVDEAPLPEPHIPAPGSSEYLPPASVPPAPAFEDTVPTTAGSATTAEPEPAFEDAVPAAAGSATRAEPEPAADLIVEPVPAATPGVVETIGEPELAPATQQADAPREVMMDFGTLELVDPESVWAQGAEDFAPWFLAHSQQLGDVLGLRAGLSDARQLTTKSATGVLGRDDNGEDVVVVSSKNAVADDSDLGRALGMAASSGAASVALVSAALHDDQLKALAWLNNQTKSGVKWYGIEMKVVRIADSPAAMLFDLVASPPATPHPFPEDTAVASEPTGD
jgi:hypothetical protein